MTTDDDGSELGMTDEDMEWTDPYLQRYVAHLEGLGREPDLSSLAPNEREELEELFRILRANWCAAVSIPALEEDPVAIALGFVASTKPVQVLLSGQKVRAVRQKRHLKVSGLAQAVADCGWTLSAKDVANLERALLTHAGTREAHCLASALGVPVTSLTPNSSDPVAEFLDWLYSSEFDREVKAWAVSHERDWRSCAELARDRMLTPARRSGRTWTHPDWLALLRAILEAMA